jgi:O-antigen/teichoic acid export membrane protein
VRSNLTAQTIAVNGANLILSFVTAVALARFLGPSGRGELAAAMLWPQALIYVASLGLIEASMYFSARPESKPHIVYTNGLLLTAVQSAVIVPLGFMLMPALLSRQASEIVASSRLFLLVIPISLITQYGMGVLQGRLFLGHYNSLRLVIPAGYLTGILLLAFLDHLSILNVILLHLSLNGLVLLLSIIALLGHGLLPRLKADFRLATHMLGYGIKLQAGTVSKIANLRLDQMLMAALLPADQLGLYVTAVSAANLLRVIPVGIGMVLAPSIAGAQRPAAEIHELLPMVSKYWALNVLTGLVLAGSLPVVIPLVFGTAFGEALWPAEILLLATIFLGAKEILGGAAQGLGSPGLISQAEIVSLLITGIALAALLPPLGILGAALATLIAYLTGFVVLLLGLGRAHRVSPDRLLRLSLSSISDLSADFRLLMGRLLTRERRERMG